MKDFGSVLLACKEFMEIELTFDGFSFSFWQLFLWGIVATVVAILVFTWLGD